MAGRPARFTQAEVTRAVKGVEAAGSRRHVVVTPSGEIVIRPAEGHDPTPAEPVEAAHEIVL